MKKGFVCYTFDVTKFRMQPNGIPEFKEMKEVYIESDNYISATIKLDGMYPSDKYVKQLVHTSDGSWPPGWTLWPKFDLLKMKV